MQEINTPDGAVYSVTQISNLVKDYLDSSPVLSDLTVSGEIANYRHPSSGHHYFSLRDSESALSCVMFRYGRGGQFLSDGAQVIVHGRISMYTARGDLQLYVDNVRPDGVGALQQAFEALKARLEAEGLFDPSRKRPLPQFPSRIAVITSPTGAVIQDITNVLRRRYPLAELVLIPSAVQGESAAPEIVRAFSALAALDDIDVVILARGGGSLEDLWPFNEEIVARAVFACQVPVVSAVGHETDFTIADYVADVRAPTPSAAAELVAPNVSDLQRDVSGYAAFMESAVLRMSRERRTGLDLLFDRLDLRAPDTLGPRRIVEDLLERARLATGRLVDLRKERVTGLAARLNGLGPRQIMKRGYSIVRLKGGPVLTDAAAAKAGDVLEIDLHDGSLEAGVLSDTGAS